MVPLSRSDSVIVHVARVTTGVASCVAYSYSQAPPPPAVSMFLPTVGIRVSPLIARVSRLLSNGRAVERCATSATSRPFNITRPGIRRLEKSSVKIKSCSFPRSRCLYSVLLKTVHVSARWRIPQTFSAMAWHRWLSIGAKAYAIFACGHVCYTLGRVLRKQLQVRTRAVCGGASRSCGSNPAAAATWVRQRWRFLLLTITRTMIGLPNADRTRNRRSARWRSRRPSRKSTGTRSSVRIRYSLRPARKSVRFGFAGPFVHAGGRTFCFCCCARSSAAAAAPFLPLRIDSRAGGELASRA